MARSSVSQVSSVDIGRLTVETGVVMMELDPESVVSWSVPSRRNVLGLEVVLSVLSEGGKLWGAVLLVRAIGREISGTCVVCLTGSKPLDELDPSCSLFSETCVSTEKCKTSFTNLHSFIHSRPHRQDARLEIECGSVRGSGNAVCEHNG
jgi:hypothetical protein